MGKAMRKYTKGKGLRWKKGDSSSTNPATKTHRQAAKSNYFQYQIGNSRDDIHDRTIFGNDGSSKDEAMSDVRSNSSALTAASLKTDISAWTQCSITSFRRLQKVWSANSRLHREMLAIIAAITEVIKEKKGEETETEYFAGLLTTLDSVETNDSRTAVLSILSLLIKRVPAEVLRKQSSQVCKPLMKILSDSASSENNALLRSVLTCLSAVLRVQDIASWRNSSTEMIYRAILSFLHHPKPKVRRQCHKCICSVLKGSDIMTGPNPPTVHPVAAITAEMCIQTLEEARATKEMTVTLHILGLLKDILSDLPADQLRTTVECVFKCMTLTNPLVSTIGLKAIHGLFVSKPSAERLNQETNGQLINALYDFQPVADDSQLVLPWLETSKQAHLNMFRLDNQAIAHLPRFVSTCMKFLLAEKTEIQVAGGETLKDQITTCVASVSADAAVYHQHIATVQRIFLNVEEGLSYQYHGVWNHVLQALAALYEACGTHGSNFLTKSLEKLAALRESPQFPFKTDLDYAFGRAIRKIGAPKVLKVVPLKINPKNYPLDLSRSWLIPLLHSNVQDTQLAYFTGVILALATELRSLGVKVGKTGDTSGARSCEILERQLWSLLPGFCTRPTDLPESMPTLAPVLGVALDVRGDLSVEAFEKLKQEAPEKIKEREDLHLDVMAALRNLVTKCSDSEANRALLAKYALNYISRLLNIYAPEKDRIFGSRLAALETAKVYFTITPHEVLSDILKKIVMRLKDEQSSQGMKQACMDITATLVPYIPAAEVGEVVDFCKNAWTSPDLTFQKKGYRCFAQLLTSDRPEFAEYFKQNLDDVKTFLKDVKSPVGSSAKGARLKCFQAIVSKTAEEDKTFMKDIFPEVALSTTKKDSTNAREVAFELIKQIGHRIIDSTPEDSQEKATAEYFEMILSGFVGSPDAIAASLLALTQAAYEFKAKLSKDLVNMLLENMSYLLKSETQAILQNVFGFLKVVFSQLSDFELGPYLPKLIQDMSEMKDSLRRSCRNKIRDLLTVLIRKFGFGVVNELVPEDDRKLISSIRKTEDRKKRQKEERKQAKKSGKDDSDRRSQSGRSEGGFSRAETVHDILDELASTDEEMEEEEKKPKSKKSKVYIAEDDEGQIIDFKDPKAAQKIRASLPATKSKSKKSDVKMAPDGRIIIANDDDEDAASELSDKMDQISLSMGKTDNEDGQFSYKAGGSGIHRSLKASTKDKAKKKLITGVEYRAKKAGGDVKLKGRPDPYAYIPLDPKYTNKRKRAKLTGQFKGIVKGARKGSSKGSSMGSKGNKMRKRNTKM
ncbi:hypothetical protein RvY_05114 [Ramazzottius varieornatus]|uniref:Uncharacterized protein n=1 Tax=Ramazzottius varieornatus TaxID=947166 RepID=A0A1D1V3T6_RAMVA|nr:hypothetical protein RvY_05114 [Ramazzottius varieornatus]